MKWLKENMKLNLFYQISNNNLLISKHNLNKQKEILIKRINMEIRLNLQILMRRVTINLNNEE